MNTATQAALNNYLTHGNNQMAGQQNSHPTQPTRMARPLGGPSVANGPMPQLTHGGHDVLTVECRVPAEADRTVGLPVQREPIIVRKLGSYPRAKSDERARVAEWILRLRLLRCPPARRHPRSRRRRSRPAGPPLALRGPAAGQPSWKPATRTHD